MGPLSQSTLVVVESGADASGIAGRVLMQLEGEPMPRFVARVRAEVAEGSPVQRVVLVAGLTHDFARIAGRADIARSAAQCVAAGGGGSLVLAASDVRGELAQRALGEILREQLGAGVNGLGVRVSLADFGATSIAA
jgi:hypothetical protein